MQELQSILKPSKRDQKVAAESYSLLAAILGQLDSKEPVIEIEETGEKIKIPLSVLKLLKDVLKSISEGQHFSFVPVASFITTQAAAAYLGCSRPHLVQLLEDGKIPFTKVGKHRRLKMEDVAKYRKAQDKAFVRELDRRVEEYESGKAKVITLDELEARVKAAYKAKTEKNRK